MKKDIFQAYWPFLKQDKNILPAVLLLGFSGSLEGLSLVVLMPILNKFFNIKNVSAFEFFGHALRISPSMMLQLGIYSFLGLSLLSIGTKLASEHLLLRSRTLMEMTLNQRLLRALFDMSWPGFLTLRSGDILNATNNEARIISQGAYSILYLSGQLVTVLVFILIAFGLSPTMTGISLFFGVIIWGIYALMGKKISQITIKSTEISSALNSDLQQSLTNLKHLRSTGILQPTYNGLLHSLKSYQESSVQSSFIHHILRSYFEIICAVFVTIFVAWSAFYRPESFTRVLIFFAVFYRLAPRLITIHQHAGYLSEFNRWFIAWKNRFERIHPFLLTTETSNTKSISVSSFEKIDIQDLRYAVENKVILDGISLSIPRGRTIAIVGDSGSGKSTFIDLLTGLLPPQSGTIKIDAHRIQEIDLPLWQRHLGLVLQSSPIFVGSILANITLGETDIDKDRAMEAARQASAWDFISQLPAGIDTLLGEQGAQLSVGQCQRIAIARALYRKPKLLILDEVTSALDAESEESIHETLRQLKKQMTIIIVSHRLNIVDIADEVILFEAGHITERGSYQEISQKVGGTFHKMLSLQNIRIP